MERLKADSKLKFNNGVEIPVLGLGVWKMQDGREVENAVTWALEAGYRHIDTAKIYGNETGVGRAIADSKLPREQIFVTTKLWNADQGYEPALRAIDESLSRLGMDYVDLYLIHWPFSSNIPVARQLQGHNRQETWRAMEEILKSGKARAIGVSNYTVEHLEEMRNYAKIMPAVDQVEFHPFLYQTELLAYCKKNDIVLEAYSPLAHGKKLTDPRIAAVAQKYGKTNAQVLIRWSLQRGCVALPKSTHQDRIKENINVFDFELNTEDMVALDGLHENLRTCWDPT
jgi:diketogulonate reductase-like aldo/keto reductase